MRLTSGIPSVRLMTQQTKFSGRGAASSEDGITPAYRRTPPGKPETEQFTAAEAPVTSQPPVARTSSYQELFSALDNLPDDEDRANAITQVKQAEENGVPGSTLLGIYNAPTARDMLNKAIEGVVDYPAEETRKLWAAVEAAEAYEEKHPPAPPKQNSLFDTIKGLFAS